MNEPLANIRSVLTRALEEATSAGHFRAALDTCKLLIPLETSIEEREAAASKPSSELDGMTHQELIAFGQERVANLQKMLESMRDDSPHASTLHAPSVQPEDDIYDDIDVPPIESPPAPVPERCEHCRGLASACETIRDDQAWLAAHLARPDVKKRLDEQAALRAKLGWDAATVRDPISRGLTRTPPIRRP